jgi:hypothetical protein
VAGDGARSGAIRVVAREGGGGHNRFPWPTESSLTPQIPVSRR